MRRLRLATETLADLAPDDLAAVAGAGPEPTTSLLPYLCNLTGSFECQSLFYECYSRGCTI